MFDVGLSDFDYFLPKSRIAAYPPKDRPSARLLHVSRERDERSHHIFRDIGKFFRAGDVLVLNNTKVLPARLFGRKATGGAVEALLLKETADGEWEALLRPGGRIKKGTTIFFGDKGTGPVALQAEVLDKARPDSGQRRIRFSNTVSPYSIGHIPLPPYLDRPDTEIDREMYQTVFAKKEGAVASPTAGLHFDKSLLGSLGALGVEIVYVTLHTSYGTFQPVAEEDLERHRMFPEEFDITDKAARQINAALGEGRRVIACGTTVVRALESAANQQGLTYLSPASGQTRLFIYPPYDFKVVSGMITNFHLPKSSLLLLVAAFLGIDKMKAAYAEAIRENYRFYSYGDAMFIE